MSSDSLWAQNAQQFQEIFGESWQRALPCAGARRVADATAIVPLYPFALLTLES